MTLKDILKIKKCSNCGRIPDYDKDLCVMSCPCCNHGAYGRNLEEVIETWNETFGKDANNWFEYDMDRIDYKLEKLAKKRNANDIRNGYKKEETEMKDILEVVDKIEELLNKSKFEWFIAYDPKEKAWNFQIKED